MKSSGIVFEQERPFVAPDKCYDVSRNFLALSDVNPTYTLLPSGLYVPTFVSNGYISAAVANFRICDKQGAIEGWVTIPNTASAHSLFSSADTGTDATYFFQLRTRLGRLYIDIKNGATFTNGIPAINSVPQGRFFHWVLTSYSGAYHLFFNGVEHVLDAPLAGANDGKWFDQVPNRDNIAMGILKTSVNYYGLAGTIGLVRIHSKPMSLSTAWSHYQAERGLFGV